ncbi:retrovirus-related pol polyprotein from transposon TNT 1-94 [Tanacetum coccineum]
MHDDVQPNYVVDSHADYTSDSNMIPYAQYVKDNAVPVIQSTVSSVSNDASMLIINEMSDPSPKCESVKEHNKVVDTSSTAELATYKEQVELYERRAKFELTVREQKIDEQLRIVIIDRNIKEANMKKELHSIKRQLQSTINHNKSMVAIGYKSPSCLTCAKQVQPALYNGHEIVKNQHVPAVVHNLEETLEIAKITRKKMNDKMKPTQGTKHNIDIRPPDYSKENFLATFTPQTQLTPEQIFWSKDVLKMKSVSLAEQAKAVKALTVYPTNTPVKLVPRTCKKRITPTGLTEGERGFEQIKECYLTEVIPFFKTLKEHFEGIQMALTKEIKEMKEIFDELEAEVDQNAVNRKSDEIEGKNLLIRNDNLIVDCLSKGVFYVASNSELTVSRFTKMLDAHAIVQARCLELEAELSKVENAKVKQHYKELYDSIKITLAKHIDQTTALLAKNENLKVQINDKLKCVTIDSVKPKVLAPGVDSCTDASGSKPRSNTKKNRISPAKSVNEKTVEDQSRTNKSNLQKPNRVDSSISSKLFELCESPSSVKNVVLKVKQIWKPKPVKQVWKATGNVLTTVGQWEPTRRTFTLGEQCPLTRFTHPKVVPAKQPKSVSTSIPTPTDAALQSAIAYANQSDSNQVLGIQLSKLSIFVCFQKQVVQIILWYLDSGCSKYMTEDHSRLMNFMKKFIGTVRFGNDHFGAIMGYRDYVIGESVIPGKHSCYVRNTDGVELIKGSRGSNLYTISVEDMLKSSPICLLSKDSKNNSWLWHHRLNHLNFGTINDLARKYLVRGLARLKFEKDHLCSACELGKSKKHSHKPKAKNTIMEIHLGQVFKIKGDETPEFVIKFLMQIQVGLNKIVRFIRTDNGTEFVNQVMSEFYEKVGIFHQKSVSRTPQQNGVVERRNRTLVEAARTMLIFSKARMFLWAEAVATACYTQNRSLIHPRHNKTPYELVHDKKPDLTFLRIFGALSGKGIESTTKEPEESWKLFTFNLMSFFSPATAVQVPVSSAGTPSSTTIDQDAPLPSYLPSSSEVQPPVSNQVLRHQHSGMLVQLNPLMLLNHILILENRERITYQQFKPKNFKSAMTEDCWFQAMQDEIHEFDRLQVWELVPRPDYVMIIALKWIYKVKLDEYDTMVDMSNPASDIPAEQALAIAPPTRTDDQILPLRKWVPIGMRPSQHLLRFLQSIFSSSGKPCFIIQLLGHTAVKLLDMTGQDIMYFRFFGVSLIAPTLTMLKGFGNNLFNPYKPSSQTSRTTGSPLHYSHEDHALGILRTTIKEGGEIFKMPIPDALLTNAIKRAPYYGGYQTHVAEYQKYLEEERNKAEGKVVPESSKATKVTKTKATTVIKSSDDTAPKPTSTQPPKPTLAPTESPKIIQSKKRKQVKETSNAPPATKQLKPGKVTKKSMSKSTLKLVDEFVDEGVPAKEPEYHDEEADLQRALELSLKELERTQGAARPVVIRETKSKKLQPLLEVQGKGKEKVTDEQAARDLLTLLTPKRKSSTDQFIFQRCTSLTTGLSGDAESPLLDAESDRVDSEMESDEPDISVTKETDTEMEVTHTETLITEEQIHEEFTSTMYPNVQDTLKLPVEEHVIFEEHASSTRTIVSLPQLDKDFNFNDQFLTDKSSDADKEKIHAEAEVESMVTVTIQKDTSSVLPMQFKVVDVTRPRPDSLPPSTTLVATPTTTPTTATTIPTTTTETTTAITTTTTLPPPPPQP